MYYGTKRGIEIPNSAWQDKTNRTNNGHRAFQQRVQPVKSKDKTAQSKVWQHSFHAVGVVESVAGELGLVVGWIFKYEIYIAGDGKIIQVAKSDLYFRKIFLSAVQRTD